MYKKTARNFRAVKFILFSELQLHCNIPCAPDNCTKVTDLLSVTDDVNILCLFGNGGGAVAGGQDDGTAQLLAMHNNTLSKYDPTSAYPISLQQFRESTQSPDYLASAWLYNFEKPLHPGQTEAGRRADALWWYDWLVNHPWVSRGSNIIPKRRALLNHRKRRLGY